MLRLLRVTAARVLTKHPPVVSGSPPLDPPRCVLCLHSVNQFDISRRTMEEGLLVEWLSADRLDANVKSAEMVC